MRFGFPRQPPRLAGDCSRVPAVVQWTLTVDGRATGWLTRRFHEAWRYALLHTGARHRLLCPAYVLMPDRAHLLWIGLEAHGSDQRVAMGFLRRVVAPRLAPTRWQPRARDRVLREGQRSGGGLARVATSIFDHPVRAGLVENRADYPFRGCCVPGYPNLDVADDDYWDQFWRIHRSLVDRS